MSVDYRADRNLHTTLDKARYDESVDYRPTQGVRQNVAAGRSCGTGDGA
jgi:hypothetical protein